MQIVYLGSTLANRNRGIALGEKENGVPVRFVHAGLPQQEEPKWNVSLNPPIARLYLPCLDSF